MLKTKNIHVLEHCLTILTLYYRWSLKLFILVSFVCSRWKIQLQIVFLIC